jgi:hypothetical protein
MQLLPGEERRRSQRVMVRIPVSLHLTIAGRKLSVQATTVSVNDHGAMVLCSRPISAETAFEMQHDRTREKRPCRVTRQPVESPDGYLIPVEFAEPAPGFWHISFPPTNWKPTEE